jgi:xanthine dehydrogenase accessory factor
VSTRADGQVTAAAAAERALAAQNGGTPVALVTVISAPRHEDVGRRLIVTAEAVMGSLGATDLDGRVVELARSMLSAPAAVLQEVRVAGEVWEVYVESQHPLPDLVIIGAGHIARPLCKIAAMLGFRVTVADDRPEFVGDEWFPEATRLALVDFQHPFREIAITAGTYVVLVTRGHKYDYDCILQLLDMEAEPAYLGMIGSRRRVRAAFEALLGFGIDPQRLKQVRAPIGLDIGAETPEEIALAIAAEIVAVRRGGLGGPLSQKEHVIERLAQKRGHGGNG